MSSRGSKKTSKAGNTPTLKKQRNSSRSVDDTPLETHASLVCNGLFSDISFLMDNGTELRAHSCVINSRCPAMIKQGVKKVKAKKGLKEYAIDPESHIDEQSLKVVLTYLYTGNVDFSEKKMNPMLSVHVINAAAKYKIERLIQMLEQYLQQKLDMKNMYALLRKANDWKVPRAKQLCLDFAMDNPTWVQSKDGVTTLGLELFQEVVLLSSQPREGAGDPVSVNAKNTFTSDFKELYDKRNESFDVTFRWADKKKEVLVKAHRALLGGKSAAIASIIEVAPPDKKMGAPVVSHNILANLDRAAFESFLRWVYYGETTMDPLSATKLIMFSAKLKLDGLRKAAEDTICSGISVPTVLSILEVSYKMSGDLGKQLIPRCQDYIVSHLDKVDLQPLNDKAKASKKSKDTTIPLIATDLLLAIQQDIGKRLRLATDEPETKAKKPEPEAQPEAEEVEEEDEPEPEPKEAAEAVGDEVAEQPTVQSSEEVVEAAASSSKSKEKEQPEGEEPEEPEDEEPAQGEDSNESPASPTGKATGRSPRANGKSPREEDEGKDGVAEAGQSSSSRKLKKQKKKEEKHAKKLARKSESKGPSPRRVSKKAVAKK
mmetsp:Transcript_11094/g.12202  ORF Transcript_11094/g.12202 Transcript_11094/m.12202 type:complete len:601 (-) Transcript_11094:86-1888(-)